MTGYLVGPDAGQDAKGSTQSPHMAGACRTPYDALRKPIYSFKHGPKFPVFDLDARGPRRMSPVVMAGARNLRAP